MQTTRAFFGVSIVGGRGDCRVSKVDGERNKGEIAVVDFGMKNAWDYGAVEGYVVLSGCLIF